MNFVVIETGGKQYLVKPGAKIKIEKIKRGNSDTAYFDRVLLSSIGGNLQIGTPYLSGRRVEARVVKQGRARKKIVFKYSSKTRYRKKKGHKQHFTEVQITNIS